MLKMEHLHSMKVVTRRTGLSPHLIRIWERRYGAVRPARTQSNRRLYSDSEVSRLLLLLEATRAGHSIGNVAKMSEEALRTLLSQEAVWNGARLSSPPDRVTVTIDFVGEAMDAVKRLDSQALEGALSRATLELGQLGMLQQVMVPVIQRIGDEWHAGKLKVVHEHAATAVIRTFLGSFARAYALPDSAPALIITTPAGHLHELGAVLVSVTASNLGWRALYLGPSLPAEEIASAAIQSRARAVALSLVYPEDDPHLATEVRRLRDLLPGGVTLLAGGRAAAAYRGVLQEVGAFEIDGMPALQAKLEELRRIR
jgi:MerR family transcriptional regulator, light-induced transcriptional regulator